MNNTGLCFIVLAALWCVSAHAVVENDNVLKGVLKEEGFTVIQDMGEITAVKSGGCPPFVFTDAGARLYRLSSRLNTVMYASDYRSALERFAHNVPADFPGTAADLSTNGDYLELSLTFDALMMADGYRSVLEEWRKRLGAINQAVAAMMKTAGKDAAFPDQPLTDPDTVDWNRDPFETRKEYAARIEAGNPYQVGTVTFNAEDYDIDHEWFPVVCELGAMMKEKVANYTFLKGVPAEPAVARELFMQGPTYALQGILKVESATGAITIESCVLRLGDTCFQNDKQVLPEDDRIVSLGNGVKMVMVLIDPGSFLMGSSAGARAGMPVHSVRITEPFWIGQTEVTQAQYWQVMGHNPSYFKGGNRPVERVSWNDARKFCKKLTAQEHQKGGLPMDCEFTLPSEAQWEYAARGGGNSKQYTYAGADSIGQVAWYAGNSGRRTHAVGGLCPNEFGLYDMSGNVWEWCLDKWHRNYKGAPKNGRAWTEGLSLRRVFRGGGWNSAINQVRLVLRNNYSSFRSPASVGFRVVAVQK